MFKDKANALKHYLVRERCKSFLEMLLADRKDELQAIHSSYLELLKRS